MVEERKLALSDLHKELTALVAEDIKTNYSSILTESNLQIWLGNLPNLVNLNSRILAKAFFLFIIRENITDQEKAKGKYSPDPVVQLLSAEASDASIQPFRSLPLFNTDSKETKVQLIESIFSYYELIIRNVKKS